MSPNLNAFAKRWVKTVKSEMLDKQVLFGKRSLQYVLCEYTTHYHEERNDNTILFPSEEAGNTVGYIKCKECLDRPLKYHYRDVA